MRRLLPLFAVALVGLIAWLVFFNPSSDDPILVGDDGDRAKVELNQPAAANAGPAQRSGLAAAEEAEFTNRPVKVGNGRHALGGQVIDEDGKGVPDAWVGAYSSPFAIADFVDNPEELLERPLELSLDPVAAVRADKDGFFDLAGLPGRSLYLTARAPMRLSNGRQRVNPSDLGSKGQVVIKAYAASQLEGTVRDSDGNPVANAEVLIYPGLKYVVSAIRKRDVFFERAYTDGSGKFALEAIPAGMVLNASAFAGPTHPGTSEFGPGARNAMLRTTVNLVELGRLEGKVINVDEEPVGRARVAAIPLDLRMIIPVLRNVPGWITESDGGGNYRFDGLPYGQYLLVAQGDEGRSAPFTARILGPAGNEKDIIMDTRNEVRGRIIDSAGNPINGANVALMSIPDSADSTGGGGPFGGGNNQMNFLLEMAKEALPEILPADTEAQSNSRGEFRIAAWRQARVRVSAPGYITGDFRFSSLPDEKQPVLVLQKPGGMSGKVMRAADEEAISFFVLQPELRENALGSNRGGRGGRGGAAQELTVVAPIAEAGEHDHEETAGTPPPVLETPRSVLEAKLGENESLLLPEAPNLDQLKKMSYADDPNGEFKIVGLTPGRWQLRVRADGFETSRETVEVQEGEMTEDVEVRLGQGSIMRGIVVDKRNGKPVESAMVSASRNKEGGFTLLAQGFMEGSPVTVSKGDGSFELRGVEANATWMHVMAEGYSSLNLQMEAVKDGEVRDNLKLEMLPGGSITGKVTDRHGAMLARRMVVAFSPGSQDFQQGATNEAGIYKIDNLQPGNYLLISVSLDDESLFTGDFMSMLSGGRFVPATVVEGETTTVDIVDTSAGGCRLSGRLTKNGVPVSGAMLSSVAMGGSGMFDFRMATARTDENGNFTFKSLAPGEYSLNVESRDWRGALDLFVDDMPEDYIELRVPETIVTGRVVSASTGAGLKGVSVRLVREDAPGGLASMFGGGGGGGWRTRANTDDQGSFTIEGAPAGDYHIVVEPDAFGNFNPSSQEFEGSVSAYRKYESKSFFLDEDQRIEMDSIELEAAGVIRATVRDAEGKKFERGFQMEAVPLVGDTETKFDGWGFNGGGTLAGLPAGSYRLTLSARGFAKQSKTVNVAAGEETPVEFDLLAGSELTVRVMDNGGGANSSAVLTIYDESDQVVHQDAGGQESMFRNFFGGSGDGNRSVGSFAPGRYRVVAVDGNRTGDTWVTLKAGSAATASVTL
jgi:protocatechuate 3,4-dioxygenase beta subunit